VCGEIGDGKGWDDGGVEGRESGDFSAGIEGSYGDLGVGGCDEAG